MSGLISPATVTAFENAMASLAASLMQLPLTYNVRVTTLDANGENPVVTTTPYTMTGLYQYSVGLGGRYHTIERTEMGQIMHDGWKVYIFKPLFDSLVPSFNPEADSITIENDGVTEEYEIRMWSPSGAFSTSGMQFYECTLLFTPGA